MAKRFYQNVSVAPVEGGFEVRLDERTVKTPQRRPLILPCLPLAEAVAMEWQAVQDEIAMSQLPLTRLCYGALDKSADEWAQARADIRSYASSDLVCYRAEGPGNLVQRQQEVWQPLLDWAASEFAITLTVTSGIIAVPQPETSLEVLSDYLRRLSPFELGGLHPAVALLGSTVIGLALFRGRVDAGEAVSASLLDELWQEESWGADEEAEIRRQRIRREIEAFERYFAALKG